MDDFFKDVKCHITSIYQKHLKVHVDKSIRRIEKTGCGKFTLDSLRSFTIWTVTCLVYIYSKLQIAYEKYQQSDSIRQVLNHYDKDGGDNASNPNNDSNKKPLNLHNVKIHRAWNDTLNNTLYQFTDIGCQDLLGKIEDGYRSDVKWYTLFSLENSNLSGIILADVGTATYVDKLVLKQNIKYLSALLVSSVKNSEIDVTDLINLYANATANKELRVGDLYNKDGKRLFDNDNDNDQLVAIDNEAITHRLGKDDIIIF